MPGFPLRRSRSFSVSFVFPGLVAFGCAMAAAQSKPAAPKPPAPVPAPAPVAPVKAEPAHPAAPTSPSNAPTNRPARPAHEESRPENPSTAQPGNSDPQTEENRSTSSESPSGGTTTTHPRPTSSTAPSEFSGSTKAIRRVAPPPSYLPNRPGGMRQDNPSMPNTAEAESALRHLNAERTRLGGVNRTPIPQGHVSMLPRGRVQVAASGGRVFTLRANGTISSIRIRQADTGTVRMPTTANFRRDGKLTSLRSGGLSVQRLSHGARVVTSRGPDHTLLVSTGPRSGYMQRTVDANGHSYLQRMYVSGGQTNKRVVQRSYLRYSYNGHPLHHYLPEYNYSIAYYEWLTRAWQAQVRYRWNWIPARWYYYYAKYYVPWPSYSGASYWLTDYFLSGTLEDGYFMEDGDVNDQADPSSSLPPADPSGYSNPDDSGQGDGSQGYDASGSPSSAQDGDNTLYASVTTPITQELKVVLAGQVQQQITLESDAATNPDPEQAAQTFAEQYLQTGYAFVVDAPLSVRTARRSAGDSSAVSTLVGADSAEHCNLSAGDVLRLARVSWSALLDHRPMESTSLFTGSTDSTMGSTGLNFSTLEVVASRRGDCPTGIQVNVPITALEDMENNFEARVDDGVQLLHIAKGQETQAGLPSPPASILAVTPGPALDAMPPDQTEDTAARLLTLNAQADQAEAQVVQAISAPTTLPANASAESPQ